MPTAINLRELEPRRVCLIKPSALGDVVHALPVLVSLRRRWPSARFSWVINRGLVGLINGHPDLDEVIPFDRNQLRLSLGGLSVGYQLFQELRKRRFDLAIDLQGLLRSGLMTAATGATVRVGRADAREGAGACYTHRITSDALHAVDRLLTIARAFGADTTTPAFRLPIQDSNHNWAEEALKGVPRPILVLNPGARWVTKRWPPSHFAEVARRAATVYGSGIVTVGAPEDSPLTSMIVGRLQDSGISVRDLTGETTLMQLAGVAATSDLFLSNDTGPLHLAVASGARTIAVFTCTDPAKTGPYDPRATVVRTEVWCAGQTLKRCDRMECMTELTTDRVWAAVDSALAIQTRENVA